MIVQPYIPEYRVAFFKRLRDSLLECDIDLVLAAGRAEDLEASRRDDRTDCVSDFVLQERRFRIGSKVLRYRSLGPVLSRFHPDLLVVEQAIKNLEVYPTILSRALGRLPSIAMWGHGRSFSTAQGDFATWIKRVTTSRAEWFFAYTQEGSDYLVNHGFDAARITVLRNTIDTNEFRQCLSEVTPPSIQEFRQDLGLTEHRTAIFLGGVDERKGIDFLLAASVEVRRHLPEFVLLVAGAGSKSQAVLDLQERGGPVRYLGRLDGRAKALAVAASDVMMIPEWVGLVAVDSLTSGCPIVTTTHESHSPEFSYLRPGMNSLLTPHEIGDYAAEVARILTSDAELKSLRTRGLRDSETLSLDSMVERFTSGVLIWRDAVK